jgi:hypothetical protein
MSQRAELLITDLCSEIDILRDLLAESRAAEQEWRKKHNDLVLADIQHGNQMMGGFLRLALTCDIIPHDIESTAGTSRGIGNPDRPSV